MMSAARSDPGLEFADRRGEQIGTAGVFVASAMAGSCVSSRLIRLAAPAGVDAWPASTSLHHPAFDLGGLVPDPAGVGRDGDMPAFHGRHRVRIGLDGRRPLRRTAAIPSPSSTRPQPSGKLRQLAHRPEERRHGAVSPLGLTSRPWPGVGRLGRLRGRFGGAGSRRPPLRPGSPASPRPALAGSRPCGVAGD